MTAPKGTAGFATAKSKESEERHKQIIASVVRDLGPDYKLTKSLKIEEITCGNCSYSRTAKGNSQEYRADGGFLWWRDPAGQWHLIAIFENKFQTARANACQRGDHYLTFVEAAQLFISCGGVGFLKKNAGGATGPFIDTNRFAGVTVLENVQCDDTFKQHVVEHIQKALRCHLNKPIKALVEQLLNDIDDEPRRSQLLEKLRALDTDLRK